MPLSPHSQDIYEVTQNGKKTPFKDIQTKCRINKKGTNANKTNICKNIKSR